MTMAISAGSDAGLAPTALAGPALAIHGPDSPQRPRVEAFIQSVYARHYAADISGFAPVLVSLSDPIDGQIVAAAGYRSAGEGPLFLEHYLRAPVESVLARHAGTEPARHQVVEIGHLAAQRPGAGRRLMLLLGPHLAKQRFGWVVCTLTREMRHLIARMGITPLALGRADPAVLGDAAAAWGSYYEHDPLVLAGLIRPALRRLARGAGQEVRA